MQILISLFAGLPVFASVLVFFTGSPELSNVGYLGGPMDRNEYRAFVEKVEKDNLFVTVRKSPSNLSSSARYGANFLVGGKNRGWILDGDDHRGWLLYLDWKGNGDLSGARPQPLKRVNSVYQLQVEVKDGTVPRPCRFELIQSKPAKSVKRLDVKIYDITVRRGVIEIGGKRAPFALTGELGRYDDPHESFTD